MTVTPSSLTSANFTVLFSLDQMALPASRPTFSASTSNAATSSMSRL
jgi:hypothetical protein